MCKSKNSETFQYIGDIAKRLGISTRAIRYYEELCLIVPKRSNGGFREYSETEVEKLITILKLKKLGLSLEEIKTLVGIKTCVEDKEAISNLLQYLHEHLHEFEEKIEDYKDGITEVSKLINFINHCKECKEHVKAFQCEQCKTKNCKEMPKIMKSLL